MFGRYLTIALWRCLLLLGVLNELIEAQDDSTSGITGESPSNVKEPWYLGCFSINGLANYSSLVEVGQASNPVYCSLACRHASYNYSTYQLQDGCRCLKTFTASDPWFAQPAESCNSSCVSGSDSFAEFEGVFSWPLLLPCGVDNDVAFGSNASVISIYKSNGPILYNISVELLEPVISAGQAFQMLAIVEFAGNYDMPLGLSSGAGADVNPAEVFFSWKISNNTSKSSAIIADSQSAQSLLVHSFDRKGIYNIDVFASNLVSFVHTMVVVPIVEPALSSIVVTPVVDSVMLPQCNPSHDATDLPVHMNSEMRFEATVPVSSTSISFNWSLVDTHTLRVQEIATVSGEPCLGGQSCTTSTMAYFFNTTGRFTINVEATNEFGAAKSNATVIVVYHGVSEMDVVLESLFVAVNDDLKSDFTVVLSSLENATMTMVFGDGTSVTLAFNDHKSYPVMEERGDEFDRFIISSHNYKTTCALFGEINHKYVTEGIFCPALIIESAAFNASIRLSNSACVTVENKILSVSLTSPKVVGVNEAFLVNATLPPGSSSVYAVFNWSATKRGSSGSNHSLAAAGSVAQWKVHAPGTYTISVLVVNAVSIVSSQIELEVLEPVTGLTAGCVVENTVASKNCVKVNTPVHCSASTSSGSSVSFLWSVHSGNSSSRSDTFFSSSFSSSTSSNTIASFTTLGKYNVTVDAFNAYNRLSFSFTVTVLEAVQNLLVVVSGASAVGEPVVLTACCESGANLTYTFDFRDQSRPFVVENSSKRSIAASHVYTSPGMYNASVTVTNALSSAEKYIEIEVLPADVLGFVHIENVTPIHVVGQTSVFLAFTTGLPTRSVDVIYAWSVNGAEFLSSLPVFDWLLTDMQVYNICVTVTVGVKNVVNCSLVEASTAASNLTFNGSVAFVYPTASFVLLNLPRSPVYLFVGYGDGTNETILTSEMNHRWNYNYSSPGLYEVHVICRADNSGSMPLSTARTFVAVHVPVTNLTLTGLSSIRVRDQCTSGSWNAAVDGSDVIFIWKIGANNTVVTRKKSVTQLLTPGKHQISVTASNRLASLTKTATADVMFALSVVKGSVSPAALGSQSIVYIKIAGSLPVKVSVDHGDGTRTVSEVSETDERLLNSSADGRDYVAPVYVMQFPHTFSSSGNYEVVANIENSVSRDVLVLSASVGLPPSNVVISTNHSLLSPLPSNVSISFTAAVEEGHSVTFSWTCDRCGVRPVVNSSITRSSIAVYYFPARRGGEFNVCASASSPFSTRPTSTCVRLTVLDPVLDVQLVSSPSSPFPLKRSLTDSWTTDLIAFTASVVQGSNVTFSFNFSDGSAIVEAEGFVGHSGRSEATVSHTFTSDGQFAVVVTASNMFGNRSATLACDVQVPISSNSLLLLDHRKYSAKLGNAITFRANVSRGSFIRYNWDFGDGHSLNDAGPVASHVYASIGEYEVSVLAYNKFGSKNDVAKVSVQDIIKSVELVPSHLVQRYNQPVTFKVHLVPSLRSNINFCAYFVESSKILSFDSECQLTHTFNSPNVHVVFVTAHNNVSSLSSLPVAIQVLREISELDIKINETSSQTGFSGVLLDAVYMFRAYHYKGTVDEYVWDFGDGTALQRTSGIVIKHTFSKLGKFHVTVNASNAVSSQSASNVVFVVKAPCTPPVITLHPHELIAAQFNRSRPIRMEADVKINCSLSKMVEYVWRLRNLTGPLDGFSIDRFTYRDPVLIIPPKSLPYGNYSVELEVNMIGTIVYGSAAVPFSVRPTPVVCVIVGGVERYINRSMNNFVIDGSQSVDPDFPEPNQLQFSWSCHEFSQSERRDSPCFTGLSTTVLPESFGTSVVRFSTSQLRNDITGFMFNLTVVSKRDRRRTSSARQLLTVAGVDGIINRPTAQIDLTIRCAQCHNAAINDGELITMHAVQKRFPVSGLSYSWQLFVVEGDDDPPSNEVGRCYSYDSQAAHSQRMANNSVEVQKFADDGVSSAGINSTVEFSPTSSFEALTTKVTVPTSTQRPTSTASAAGPAHPAIFGAGEGGSSSSTGVGGGRGRYSPSRQIPVNEGDGGFQARPNSPLLGSTTDNPTGAFTSNNAPLSGIPSFPAKGLPMNEGPVGSRAAEDSQRSNPSASSPDQKDVPDLRKAPGLPSEFIPFILQRSNRELVLSTLAATDIASEVLVIDANRLSPGRTYIVKLTVVSKGVPRLVGSAVTFFTMNSGPSLGRCTLKPATNGTEMATVFKAFCTSWRDTDMPLSYEVSYQLQEGDTPSLVYFGLQSSIDFVLPAGLSSRNYSVTVNIAIVDGVGIRTEYCSAVLQVFPASFTDEQLEQEARLVTRRSSWNSSVAPSVSQSAREVKPGYLTRLHTLLLATIMNRNLPNGMTSASRRAALRLDIIESLAQVPLRDLFEVQQTLAALQAVTAVAEELDVDGCMRAIMVFNSTVGQVDNLLSSNWTLDSGGLVPLSINIVSNILASLSSRSTTAEYIASPVSALMNSVDHLMKIQLRPLVIRERMQNVSAPHLSTHVARYNSSVSEITFGDVNVRLPPAVFPGNSLAVKLHNTIDGGHSRCYQISSATYRNNPLVLSLVASAATQKPYVVSLNLYTCQNEAIVVQNLTKELVALSIPVEVNQETDTITLHRSDINIHQFNTSSTMLTKPLHVEVELSYADSRSRPFGITVLLSLAQPRPDEFLSRWVFKANVTNISFVIDSAKLAGSNKFYLGIVDSSYDSGQPRPDQLRSYQYKLRLWSGQCVYWDETRASWSDSGCQLDPTSRFNLAKCSCSHLTSFAVQYSVSPSTVYTQPVSSFFPASRSAAVPAVIGAVILVYVCLVVVLHKFDQYDNRKSEIVQLVDNSVYDRQKYYISLETGFRKSAGTTAKVSIVLHGEYGMSETRELVSQSGQPLFERSSRDIFYLTFPESLGRILKVQLWHDNSGISPGWYLSRVVVKDACTGESYYFIFERWFAVEKGDGKLEREVMAVDRGLAFSKVMKFKIAQYLTDYHLWFSTFIKPSYSRFSRVQRLTCCLCLLMSYLAINAVWFYFNNTEYRGEFTLVDLSWTSIVVGIIVSLVALPPNLLIALVFRRSAIKMRRFQERDTNPDADGNLPESQDSQTTSQHETDLDVSFGFYQSMVAWKNLQDWAQRVWAKHYQQSPIGSTQNVEPIIVQDFGDRGLLECSPHLLVMGRGATTGSGENVRNRVVAAAKSGVVTRCNEGDIYAGDCPPASQEERRTSAAEYSQAETESTLNPSRFTSAFGQPSHTRLSVGQQVTQTCSTGYGGPRSESASKRSSKSLKSRSNNSSEGSSPATSFSESSPKLPHRANLMHDVVDRNIAVDRSGLHPPPSFGRDFRRQSALRTNSNQSQFSNRSSSVKSTKSSLSAGRDRKMNSAKPARCFFPHFVVYVIWAICVVITGGAIGVTVYFGIGFTYQQSVLWMQSSFFSCLQCVFVTHPLIVILATIYTALRYRNDMSIFDYHNDGIVLESTANANKLNKSPSSSVSAVSDTKDATKPVNLEQGISARQRSRYLRFARPPQEQVLIEARNQTMKESNARALVNETLLFVIQFLLIVAVTYGKSPGSAYQLNHSLKEAFSHGQPAWANISDVPMWWKWVQGPFIDIMTLDSGDGKVSGVCNSVLVGQMNLRQLRVNDVSCDRLDNQTSCMPFFDIAVANNRVIKNEVIANTTYKASTETGAAGIQGKFGFYGGDGYLVTFDANIDSSVISKKLEQLEQMEWIDAYTSAVLIDMTLFHVESTLFSSVTLILELPPLNLVQTTENIVSVYLYKYTSAFDHFILACELMFFVAMLVKIHHESIKVMRSGVKYIKNIWNIIEVSQCLLSLALCIGLVYRFMLVMTTLEKFRSTYFENFVDVSDVEFCDKIMRVIAGFVLVLIALHLLKSLRHHQPFAMFANIYGHTSLDIVILAWMIIVWIGAFSSLGVVLFGTMMPEFGSFSAAVCALLSIATRVYSFDLSAGSLTSTARIGWHVYAMIFFGFGIGSMAAYFKSALNFNYKVFKTEAVFVFPSRDSFRYYWTRLQELLHIRLPDNHTSANKGIPPDFAIAEIQFQVDEMLFRINALAGTSDLPEKPNMYYTDSDTTCGGGGSGPGADDGLSIGGSEPARGLYEDEKLENKLQKLRDNLFVNEPHLAELLRLDSIGAAVGNQQNTEQHLMMQLEMEIFRQLQMQRREERPGDWSDVDAAAAAGGGMAAAEPCPWSSSASSTVSSSVNPNSSNSSNVASASSPNSIPSSHTTTSSGYRLSLPPVEITDDGPEVVVVGGRISPRSDSVSDSVSAAAPGTASAALLTLVKSAARGGSEGQREPSTGSVTLKSANRLSMFAFEAVDDVDDNVLAQNAAAAAAAAQFEAASSSDEYSASTRTCSSALGVEKIPLGNVNAADENLQLDCTDDSFVVDDDVRVSSV